MWLKTSEYGLQTHVGMIQNKHICSIAQIYNLTPIFHTRRKNPCQTNQHSNKKTQNTCSILYQT
ncbi:hypothetical protein Hanom_Chr09g00825611 [Helianthus anomalus]